MSLHEIPSLPLYVAVLAGGNSAERQVSLQSGCNVTAALRERGHRVQMVDPSQSELPSQSCDFDIILPMLHGTGAEDGTLQTSLDGSGIPWVGSSAAASRLTFDKIATRNALQAAGFPVAPGVDVDDRFSGPMIIAASRSIGFPQVIKPAEQGSSVGISIVHQESELADAVREVTRWGQRFLIEKFIAGREVTIPVIDGFAFPAVEILPSRAWYDYAAKYDDDDTRYHVAPPGIPDNLGVLVRGACRLCGVTAISRTDIRIDESGRPWLLEINTIPGMTSHSLVPMSARSLGISLGELCEQLLLKKLGRIVATTWEVMRGSRPQAA